MVSKWKVGWNVNVNADKIIAITAIVDKAWSKPVDNTKRCFEVKDALEHAYGGLWVVVHTPPTGASWAITSDWVHRLTISDGPNSVHVGKVCSYCDCAACKGK